MRPEDIERAVKEGVGRTLREKQYLGSETQPASVVELLKSIDSRLEQLNNTLDAMWDARYR